ncbi:MAG TPA: 2-C-methyl-D-erythritol 2,4-cyclodiphosphate synthase [Syntrophomonadaceae bacterium]|nr:2-C-methyl-D-erythritol 2,4-cyclodiphosphate synthase [Syntrophomonadaceae bacterium]
MRVGIGYDVHRFSEGRKLILGGIHIPYHLGLLGHSDADVLIHAICDALLGAAALGDIGVHFPDNDLEYKDVNSMFLLSQVSKKLIDSGYSILNIDSTIIAEEPKLASYLPSMCAEIASALDIGIKQVNVKATTTEKLGFEGRAEGISAQAIVLIVNKNI